MIVATQIIQVFAQARFTMLLGIPYCFFNIGNGFLFLIITVILDLIVTVSGHFITLVLCVRDIYKDRKLFNVDGLEVVSNDLTSNLESYFKKTAYNIKGRLNDKQFVFVMCPKLAGCCLSYPYTFGENIILLPATFDFNYPRDIALLAHEMTHCLAHELYRSLYILEYFLCATIITIAITYSFLTNTWWAGVVAFALPCIVGCNIYLSSIGSREQDANLWALRFIEDEYSVESMRNAATVLMKLRQVQYLDKCKFPGPIFFSEQNQIHFLSYLVPLDESVKMAWRLVKKAQNNPNYRGNSLQHTFLQYKYEYLVSLYEKGSKLSSTHGITIASHSKIEVCVFFAYIILAYLAIYTTDMFSYVPSISWWCIVGVTIFFFLFKLTGKILNITLWKIKLKLTEKIGI